MRRPALLLLLLGACGYSFGTGLHERGVHSVALEIVGNETFRQRFENDLSSALARELPVSADLELADRATADSILQVVLTQADERTLVAGDRSQPVREGAIEGRVTMRLVGRDGRLLLERRILDRTEFRSTIGESLDVAPSSTLTSARQELEIGRAHV